MRCRGSADAFGGAAHRSRRVCRQRPQPLVTLLDEVVAHLERLGIAHALIGAAALALHGISRSTLDQDILVTDPQVLEEEFWKTFVSTALVDRRRGDSADPLAGVVRIEQGQERAVDLIVGRSAWQADMLNRAERVLDGSRLRVVRAADLALLKLYAGGSQDRWDIEQLLAADESRSLSAEVEARLPDLPARCAALWGRLRDAES